MRRNSTNRRGRGAALVALASTLTALAFAGPAMASGTVTEYLGATPDGASVPAGPWTGINAGSIGDGPFGVQIDDGVDQGWTNTATLNFPAGLTASSVSADRSYNAPAMPARYQPGFATSFESVGWPTQFTPCLGHEWDNCYSDFSGDGPVSVNNPGGSLQLTAICNDFGGTDSNPRCTDGANWIARSMTLQLNDPTPPTASLTAGGGTLLNGAWQTTATGNLNVTAGDVGAGVYRSFWRESGATVYSSVDPTNTTCQDIRPGAGNAYEFAATTSSLVPCVTATRAYTPTFNLAALGDGTHTGVDLGVEDASGRETLVASNQTIRINAPGNNPGPAGSGGLPDPGTPCTNGAYDDSGTCIARPPSNTSLPILSGDSNSGGTLTTDDGAWNDVTGATYAVTWEECDAAGANCHTIPGENGSSINVTDDYAGETIRSVVTATNAGGSTSSESAPSPIVQASTPHGGTGGSGGLSGISTPIIHRGGGTVTTGGGSNGSGNNSSGDGMMGFSTPSITLPTPPAGGSGPNGDQYADEPLILAAKLATGSKTEPYGKTNTITGNLATNKSQYPVRKAQIDVIATTAQKGAKGVIVGSVTTDAKGNFTFTVPAGTSRIYTFGYRLTLDDTKYAYTTNVAVPVAAKVTMRASAKQVRKGAKVTWVGTVAGAAKTSRKLVELQVKHGKTWTAIGTTRLKNGTFAYSQQMARTARNTKYTVRAVVTREATWPLMAAQSKAVTVNVTKPRAKAAKKTHAKKTHAKKTTHKATKR